MGPGELGAHLQSNSFVFGGRELLPVGGAHEGILGGRGGDGVRGGGVGSGQVAGHGGQAGPERRDAAPLLLEFSLQNLRGCKRGVTQRALDAARLPPGCQCRRGGGGRCYQKRGML